MRNGGHVAALHLHRHNQYFGKVDLKNFFYSIARNRVSRALQNIGIRRSGHYARWSCVRNPYGHPRYALPLGFVQSPVLASLVLCLSEAGKCLESMHADVTRSVYMDDISFSGSTPEVVNEAIDLFSQAISRSELFLNPEKTILASESMLIFACHIENSKTYVTQDRINTFYSTQRSVESAAGFEAYRASVSTGSA
ncbi:reverse transcriptase domain-containing protein [Falsirhodobacter halotolerans]|uniref:reverse transcriptase domain-containing protein n=1 Tax=Falsirhodobacter halotolerans TaxID=1146892 RepID=UPI003CC807AD